jgi:hypothetical protein
VFHVEHLCIAISYCEAVYAWGAAEPALGICHRSEEFRSAEQYPADLHQHEYRDHQWFQSQDREVCWYRQGHSGKAIKIDQLWGIKFGGGTASNGKKNELYFTAGPNNNVNGLFGKIAFQ